MQLKTWINFGVVIALSAGMQARQQGNTTVHRIHGKAYYAVKSILVAIAYPPQLGCHVLCCRQLWAAKRLLQKSVALVS